MAKRIMRNSSKPVTQIAPAAPTPVAVSSATVTPSPSAKRPPLEMREGAAKPSLGERVSRDEVSRRAYEIWQSGAGGSETENWLRAEQELAGPNNSAAAR